jgi:hypothetical protein
MTKVWPMEGGIVKLFYDCGCEAVGKDVKLCPTHDTRDLQEFEKRITQVRADVEAAQKKYNEKAGQDAFMRTLLGEDQ